MIREARFIDDTFGEVEPSMQINFGGISTEEATRTLSLFAHEVMPAFRDNEPSESPRRSKALRTAEP